MQKAGMTVVFGSNGGVQIYNKGKLVKKAMPKLIYYRITGNAVTFSVHSINSLIMLSALQDEMVLKDPDIKTLASMQSRFLTIWNVAFQLAYAGLALTCDVLTVLNKDHLLPKPIKKYRDVFFSSIVFPITILVVIIFWPVFLYDRSLIFPVFIDKVLTDKSNYVMHLAIFPFALWELAFQPRNTPKSHKSNIAIIALIYLVYDIHVHVTYYERGIWPYPFVYMVYGTIYHLYLHVALCIVCLASYYVQWPLYTLIWDQDKKISEKSK